MQPWPFLGYPAYVPAPYLCPPFVPVPGPPSFGPIPQLGQPTVPYMPPATRFATPTATVMWVAEPVTVLNRRASVLLTFPAEAIVYRPVMQRSRYTLCERFDIADPLQSCRFRNGTCRFVHADPRLATSQQLIHINFGSDDARVQECHYERLSQADDGSTVMIALSDAPEGTQTPVSRFKVLKTACEFNALRRQARSCDHFRRGECDFGPSCHFAHVLESVPPPQW